MVSMKTETLFILYNIPLVCDMTFVNINTGVVQKTFHSKHNQNRI